MRKPRVVDLVFEGGGMRGIAFIGALRAFDIYNFRPGRLLGSSVGSLFATLIAAGYSPDELRDQIFDSTTGALRLTQHFQPFHQFEAAEIEASATRRLLKAVNLPWVPDGLEGGFDSKLAGILMRHPALKSIFTFIERAGVSDPEPFVAWVKELLEAKIASRSETPASSMTLAQFHQVTGYSLSLIAANVTNPTMLILNHVTAPDCPVVQAVRMATAAPLFFPPVAWKAAWGLYRRQELTGDMIVDGGLLSNFPIELFLSQQDAVLQMMGKPKEGAGVLGLLLDESTAVPGAPRAVTPAWQLLIDDFPGLTLIGQISRTAIEARDRLAIESASEYIVRLPTMGYDPYMFDLTPEQLQPLLNAGYNAMVAHLEKYQFPTGIQSFGEAARKHVDNRAMHIINVYGNLVHVDQKINEVSGTVIGVKERGAGGEEK